MPVLHTPGTGGPGPTQPGSPLILPQLFIELEMSPSGPSVPVGTLLLDDTVYGHLGTDFLAGSSAFGGNWTDISAFVFGFTISRPSTRVQGPLLQYQAGTATVTVNNSDGRFDPDNLGGPYVLAGVSQIRAMMPIRIRAVFQNVDYHLFHGYVDSWQETPVSFAGNISEWVIGATDGFKILGGLTLPTVTPQGGGELTGSRVNRILDAAHWFTGQGGNSRMTAAGDSALQTTTLGDTALNLLQLAVDSELGQLYVNGSGAVVFRNRRALVTDSRSITSQATFGDNAQGSELPAAQIGRADDDTTIGNDIQATIVGGNLQEVTDPTSIAKYLFPRTYTRSDLILTTDADAKNWAGWILQISAQGEDRFETITLDPMAQPTDLWPQILGRDMGDRVTVVRRPPGVSPGAVTRQCFISGIDHSFDTRSFIWSTTFTFQDASKYGSFFTLDNAVLGKLNQNALIF